MYTVKEIFYSIQGEGANVGRPAVFLRFAGCNLWTGKEQDRQEAKGSCGQWCDTDFRGGEKYETPEALADAVAKVGPVDHHRFVVVTGGEPLIQLDEPLLECLRGRGFTIAVETNGTIPAPPGIDWLTVSPKAGAIVLCRSGDELKLVYPQDGVDPAVFEGWRFRHWFLQPMDGPKLEENTMAAVQYCMAHPKWKLSLQIHKFLKMR